jgi:hypothetical protein
VNLTCEDLRNLLYEHHAGELVVEVCESFEAHLVGCANCLNLVQSYQTTVKIVRSMPRCGLPTAVESRLRNALKSYLGE